MIGKLRAAQEVRRLRVTNYFSMLDEESVGELSRMLTFAESEIVAVAVINQWLEEQTERPTPADLRRLVAAHNEARSTGSEPLVITWKCGKCRDSGYHGGDFAGPDSRPWQWCDCPLSWAVRSQTPLIVEEANAVRSRLMAGSSTLKMIPRPHQNVEKVYRDV